MSWAIGFDSHWQRDIGYGVPAFCDHPRCRAEIDRGLSYVCGGEPYGGDKGCGLYFCEGHLSDAQRCSRCRHHKPPFTPTPDHPRWVQHKLTDASWEQWRAENPEEVATSRGLGIDAGGGDMKVDLTRDPNQMRYLLSGEMSESEVLDTRGAIVRVVIERAAELLAQRFIDEHGQAILAALDPQAVANLAIADSGRAIREALEKAIPHDVQHHHHHDREFYKVGLFGNVRRVR